jgi:NAD(P)H dehydrogenase (quinone)
MAKVLVLYYSSLRPHRDHGQAVAEGARAAGATVDIKRVPETAPPEVVAKNAALQARPGRAGRHHRRAGRLRRDHRRRGTRFGRMTSQMAAFLDQAGGLWARGALNGKVGGAFTSTATQHGGKRPPCSRSSPTCCTSAW